MGARSKCGWFVVWLQVVAGERREGLVGTNCVMVGVQRVPKFIGVLKI
jgi:hypothetical protein